MRDCSLNPPSRGHHPNFSKPCNMMWQQQWELLNLSRALQGTLRRIARAYANAHLHMNVWVYFYFRCVDYHGY